MSIGHIILATEISDLEYVYDVFGMTYTSLKPASTTSWRASSYENITIGTTQTTVLSNTYLSNLTQKLVPLMHNQTFGVFVTSIGGWPTNTINFNLTGYDGTGSIFYEDTTRLPKIKLSKETTPQIIPVTGCFVELETNTSTNELSGVVEDNNSNVFSVTGTINPTTRNVTLDLHELSAPGFILGSTYSTRPEGQGFVPQGTYIPTSSVQVIATYRIDRGNYNWYSPISNPRYGASLYVSAVDYTTNFAISSLDVTNSPYISVGESNLYPKTTNIVELDKFINYVTLQVNRIDIKTWDLSAIPEEYVTWTVSAPLCATTTRAPITSFDITSSRTLPVVSGCDVLKFYSTNTTDQTFIISGFIPSKSVVIPTYTFNYDPYGGVSSEALNVDLISATDFSIWLQLKRIVHGYANDYNGTYPLSANTPIRWDISPSTNTYMYSGLSGLDVFYPYHIEQTLDISQYGGSYTPLMSGYSGLVRSIERIGILSPTNGLIPAVTAVTGYDNTVGIDIVEITFPTTSITYTISGMLGDYSKYDTYTFIPNLSTAGLYVSALSIDLQPPTKELTLKALNRISPGVYGNINTNDHVIWEIHSNNGSSLDSSAYAKYPNGLTYNLGASAESSVANTMVFYVTSNSSLTPALCSFTVYVSALTGGGVPLTYNYPFTFNEYLDNSIFDPTFRINYENPREVNGNMWRLTGSYDISAYDLSYIPNAITGYTRIWDWGDGTTSTSTSNICAHTYTAPSLTSFSLTMAVSNVSITGPKGPYYKESPDVMKLTFVDRFLSGVFIAYPSLVFPTSSTEDAIQLQTNNYTSSQGVCAYGEGHTETFKFSALEPASVTLGGNSYTSTYRWRYGNNRSTGNNKTISLPFGSSPGSYTAAGTSVALDIFNDVFPLNTMVSAHTADSGNQEIYPNFGLGNNTYAYTQPANTDILFQTVRMLPYESPSATITDLTLIRVIPTYAAVGGTANILWPSNSPVTIDTASPNLVTWTISAADWYAPITPTQTYNNFDLSYTLILGDGRIPGTIRRNQLTELVISVSGNIYGIIDYPPSDWQASPTALPMITYTQTVSVFTEPQITIYTDNTTALTGELVTIENTTPQTPTNFITGFVFDGGNGVLSAISGFGSFENIYYTAGIYDITVSAIAFDGTIFTQVFNNALNIVNNYEPFDSDIFRVYQTTELALPYTLNEILMPPNEWVVSDNINACFNKLLANNTYLTDATKMYNPPPAGYYGWCGTSINTDTTSPLCGTKVFGWRTMLHNTSAAERTDLIIDDAAHFTNVKDLVFKNTWLYVANGGTLEIRADDSNATLIDSRSYKGIGDPFIRLDSVQVDSRDRIYILDSPKNRVVVFGYDYSATDKWEILYGWGGLGGATAKTKFQSPTQLILDSSDDVWIVDSGNGVIKTYSSTGSWKNTISSTKFNNSDNKPLSLAIDSDDNIHVLVTAGYVVKMTKAGTFITQYTYSVATGSTPKRIIKSDDTGFLYVISNTSICKVRNSGQSMGMFGDIIGTQTYEGGFQDSDKNLFVANTNSIIKFNERLQVLDTLRDNSDKMWTTTDILIDKDEYIQSWVYDKSFSRLHDNILIILQSIRGKITVRTTETGEFLIGLAGYSPSEYRAATTVVPKSDVLIGINELVTSDVINRPLAQLYSIQQKILGLL